jgi:dTDP-3-amino-3,4,6-trideoxy-alpha-D-glucose transaminase
MHIPFLDLKRQYIELEAEITAATARVLGSGSYILGPEVGLFENEWATFCGSRGAAAVASGTDALTLALMASGAVLQNRGDEVITSPLSSPYTALGIVNAGGIPVFADINPSSCTLDPAEIDKKINSRTKAIVPVHLYGRMAEMKAIYEIAARQDLFVLEDAAQAHGARSADLDAKGYSRTSAFSFYPTKNLGAFGDSGAVVSTDESLIEQVKNLRQGGHAAGLRGGRPGLNSRLDDLQAAVLRVKLNRLEVWNNRRRELAGIYTEGLRGLAHVISPYVSEPASHVHHLYVIQSERRDALRRHLLDCGIETLVHYPSLLHREPLFCRAEQPPLPVAERIAKNILSLPLYPQMKDEEVHAVIEAIRVFPR